MTAVILDTETTDATDDSQIIELAYSDPMQGPHSLFDSREITVSRFSSDRPISLGAMATHHIIDADLIGLPRFTGFDPDAMGIQYIIGHNIDFDWRMLGRPKVRRICTLALARSRLPLLDAHTLGALVYQFAASRDTARKQLRKSHSADGDVRLLHERVLPALLAMLPRVETWEQLWIISEDARIPSVLSFGKHKGMAIGDVPQSYKRWLLDQPDVDPYLAVALRR